MPNANPYMYPQYPQYTPQPDILRGRYVASIEDVMPNDVPMDGSAGYFPERGGERIAVKKWDCDGRIVTTVYQRIGDGEKDGSDDISTIIARLDELDKKLGELV